jgi:SNF2 family DNA or RNA helicase
MNIKVSKHINKLLEGGHKHNEIENITNNINIHRYILDKLLPYQTLHTINMISAVRENMVSIDGSYTGTGKTYTTLAVCTQLNLMPFIICPKSVINKWIEVLGIFNLDYITVVNYETVRNCKMYDKKGNIINCKYIRKDNNKYIWDFKSHIKHRNIIVIFDEVHKCKNHKTLNGKLLMSSRYNKTLMLSATLCDKNIDFGIFGLMLGFYKSHRQGKNWIKSIMRESKNQYGKNKGNILHKYLYQGKGSHMAMRDLGNNYPMNQISIDCYMLNDNDNMIINEYYNNIKKYYREDNVLEKITYMRQKIENTKSSIMIELMNEYHEKNRSVVLFVNFISTHSIITSYLDRKNIPYEVIHGNQDIKERKLSIDRFQNNEIRIIVCMIQAGGTSISLHDLTGRFPRVAIISPSYSSIELIQTLGRIHRAGVKSPCLQKIVYCANTCEENIANILRKKKNFIQTITDDDIDMKKTMNICKS